MAAVRLTTGLRLFWRVHRWLFRVSGGRVGRRMNGFDVLLLTTRGRRSGEPRRVALQSLEHGGGWAVIGSRAGDTRQPDWYHYLAAEPMAEVMVGGKVASVRAREAEGEERAELWARFVAVDDAYEEYARRTTRRIPVVVLDRTSGG
jgi:F420H(2)-dependent quinone reductase